MARKLSGGQKAVLWLGALLCVWAALHNTHIVDSLFVFLTVGVVPGTSIKLSADTVLGMLPVVFGLIVLLIFRREAARGIRALFRSLRRREAALEEPYKPLPERRPMPARGRPFQPVIAAAVVPDSPEVVAEEAAFIAGEAAPELAAERPLTRTAHARRRLAGKVAAWLHRLDVRLGPPLQKLAYLLGYYWEVVSTRIRRAAALAWRVIKVEGRAFAVFTRKMSVRLWRWAEPHLRRFDAWLGVKLQELLGGHYAKRARVYAREARKYVLYEAGKIRRRFK